MRILWPNHRSVFHIHDGAFVPVGPLPVSPDSRGLRYGEGLFETMKMHQGRLLLAERHFGRLFRGLDLLGLSPPPSLAPETLHTMIDELCRRNGHAGQARIRLMVYTGEGPEEELHYLIQSWPLAPEVMRLNEEGLRLGVYADARITADRFSALKSGNYLPYLLAARHAQAQGLDDCLLLNGKDRVAETSIANVFVWQKGEILTPPLSEGSVEGVMRGYLLDLLRARGAAVRETPLTLKSLAGAGELWLTNALRGLRWVSRCGDARYSGEQAALVHGWITEQLARDYPG